MRISSAGHLHNPLCTVHRLLGGIARQVGDVGADTDNLHAALFFGVLCRQLAQLRHLAQAWIAKGRPDVDHRQAVTFKQALVHLVAVKIGHLHRLENSFLCLRLFGRRLGFFGLLWLCLFSRRLRRLLFISTACQQTDNQQRCTDQGDHSFYHGFRSFPYSQKISWYLWYCLLIITVLATSVQLF